MADEMEEVKEEWRGRGRTIQREGE